ncbi:MAG: hypothetical protein NUV59_00890, partial [Patescibacteria group bacterium]|nr:hypothetical protein [Patescibacteria group bacterium]
LVHGRPALGYLWRSALSFPPPATAEPDARDSALRRSPPDGGFGQGPRSESRASGSAVAGGGKLSALRHKYPNAGRPWTKEYDDVLEKLFREKVSAADIATELGRKPSAIRSRLMHLGLIPNPWAKGKARRKS